KSSCAFSSWTMDSPWGALVDCVFMVWCSLRSGMTWQAAQYGAYRAGIGVHQRQGQGNQLVVAGIDVVQHQVLEHSDVVPEDGVVAGQGLAVGGVYAGCVDPDQHDAVLCQVLDGV